MKTAQELRITEELREALIMVMEHFRSGEAKHADRIQASPRNPEAIYFNMCHWHTPVGRADCYEPAECGTICCIGGYAENLSKQYLLLKHVRMGEGPRELRELLMMDGTPAGAWDITVEQAAQAIQNYLTTGKARWRDILTAKPATDSVQGAQDGSKAAMRGAV